MVSQKSNLESQKHISNLKNEFRERCYHYSIAIIKLIKDLPGNRVYYAVSDQFLRSATSVGANIVEAKSASSKKDFINIMKLPLNLPMKLNTGWDY
jgi:hypothetical protein